MLKKVFLSIEKHLTLNSAVEISFEGEPISFGNAQLLDLLKTFNVSRISFGVQTYDENLRKLFNINATLHDIEKSTKLIRDYQFDEINVDMMYSLPGQTITHLEQDIYQLQQANFDSVDYYSLHYFAFPAHFKAKMENGTMPGKPIESMNQALLEQIRYSLLRYGYHNVADQIFSKNEKVSEYFRLLWGGGQGQHNAETVAVGASARGYIDGRCYMNSSNVHQYINGLEHGLLPVEKISDSLVRAENRGAVFFSKFFEIEKKYTHAINSIDPQLLSRLIKDGYIYETTAALILTEKGKRWTNNITRDLFERNQRMIVEKSMDVLVSKPGIRTGSF